VCDEDGELILDEQQFMQELHQCEQYLKMLYQDYQVLN